MTHEQILQAYNLADLAPIIKKQVLDAMSSAVLEHKKQNEEEVLQGRKYRPVKPVSCNNWMPLVVLNESSGYYMLVVDDKPVPCQLSMKLQDGIEQPTTATVTFTVLPGVEIK